MGPEPSLGGPAPDNQQRHNEDEQEQSQYGDCRRYSDISQRADKSDEQKLADE